MYFQYRHAFLYTLAMCSWEQTHFNADLDLDPDPTAENPTGSETMDGSSKYGAHTCKTCFLEKYFKF